METPIRSPAIMGAQNEIVGYDVHLQVISLGVIAYTRYSMERTQTKRKK
jgi:hypothetical protein